MGGGSEKYQKVSRFIRTVSNERNASNISQAYQKSDPWWGKEEDGTRKQSKHEK